MVGVKVDDVEVFSNLNDSNDSVIYDFAVKN